MFFVNYCFIRRMFLPVVSTKTLHGNCISLAFDLKILKIVSIPKKCRIYLCYAY